ncbi:MAG: hypothetical protein WCY88_14355 [Spongiibacteraceae bacterium]
MQNLIQASLENEWALLQNQFDSYEKHSLLIKLTNIVILSLAFLSHNLSIYIFCLLLILWAQDAIWKTFQSRIEIRLLQIESALLNNDDRQAAHCQAYQFNSHYQKSRPGSYGLIKEYWQQAIRPTVLFPHVPLILLLTIYLLFFSPHGI